MEVGRHRETAGRVRLDVTFIYKNKRLKIYIVHKKEI